MSRVYFLAGLLFASAGAARAQDLGMEVTFGGRVITRSLRVTPRPAAGTVLLRTGPSDPLTDSFDTVLLHGVLPEPSARFLISRKAAGGAWSAWIPARIKRFPNGRFWAKAVFPSSVPGTLRVLAIASGGRKSHVIELFAFAAFDSARGAAAQPSPKPGPQPGPDRPRPPVITRSAWGAHPPREVATPHRPVHVTQHHTAGTQPESLEESVAELRFIQNLHQEGRGWSDIGYHFLIDAAGRIFQGRPETVIGAHTAYNNDGNVGVALMGYHHPPRNDPVTPQQMASLKRLGGWILGAFTIAPDKYRGHRELRATVCPGDLLHPRLAELRDSWRGLPSETGFSAAGRWPSKRQLERIAN